MRTERMKAGETFIFLILLALVAVFLSPILIVLMNSFKGKFFISDTPFKLPDAETYAGWDNYTSGLEKTGFLSAFGMSLFITVLSVGVIVLFTAMAAWYITRVNNAMTRSLYYVFVFSMIVPFQMVMFTMTKVANVLHLDKDRKSTRLNSSHIQKSRMPSSA